MFNILARSIAIGVFAAGALLGASGVASALPDGPDDHDEYIDEDLPADVSDSPVLVAVADLPGHRVGMDFLGPNVLTYCPPGYHVAPDAIPIPGIPKGCEPSIP